MPVSNLKVIVTGGSGFIGEHLIETLLRDGYEVSNLDIRKPRSPGIAKCSWRDCSLLDREALQGLFRDIQPAHVIHLAAVASMDARSLDEFAVNTVGTANLLDAIKTVSSVERLIVTSTQHVRRPGSGTPVSDTEFFPYLYYGESKVITEQITRAANLNCAWTIIRPTAVWGPGHPLLAEGLWKLMTRGRYFHPAGDPVVRSYGYVKNVAWQIVRMLEVPKAAVDRKVFYVADGNGRQIDWVNAVSIELTGREVRTLPLWCIRALAALGDCARSVGVRFPIYGSRLKNLITDNPVPVEPTLELLGQPPYSLVEGAKETATWLRNYYSTDTK